MSEQQQDSSIGGDQNEVDSQLDGIAIVGMSLRLPGANSAAEFWQNLANGVESIQQFNDAQLRQAGVAEEKITDPNFVKVRGCFDDPEAFDAAFFGYSTRDAELMDPQHRVFLEACWSALEDAGYPPSSIDTSVGVWGGMSTGMENNTYLLSNLHGNPASNAPEDELPMMLGNENDYLTTRVSYKLNLRGPSVNVQSACSTSLVAITQAYQSLLTYGCDMALAGGVSVSYPQADGYLFQEGGIGSPDGHCRPFDAKAAGTVFSNGVAVVALKRLEDAVADSDNIIAVIRGAAMNNDGAAKMSFAAPSVAGQAEVVATAMALAEVEADDIGYVECHGTATPIGDPIEVTALTTAYRETTQRTNYCALGSVKSNFGHLDSAAGVAGFIKAALSLQHGSIPPTLHFKQPNPNIDFANSPFYVCKELTPWPEEQSPRRAGVSAFGIGGTNVHLILEQAPDVHSSIDSTVTTPRILPISAKTESALSKSAENLSLALSTGSIAGSLADTAFTLQQGRERFKFRQAVVACDAKEAAELLSGANKRRLVTNKAFADGCDLAFLYAGGGTQYVNMALGLYNTDRAFAEDVDSGIRKFEALTGKDLRSVWFPKKDDGSTAAISFQKPSLQLPAIFIVEMALTNLWRRWGIVPNALVGHSMGENTAACVAGILSYDDALGLVALRGRLFEVVESSGMLSVACSANEAARFVDAEIALATINAPEQVTLSGSVQALEQLSVKLEQLDIDFQLIPIAIAAHSHLLDPILEEFRDYLAGLSLSKPTLPIMSNFSGTWLTDEQAVDPDYWVDHLRNTVQFSDNVTKLVESSNRVLLEVGPGKVLGSLARLHDSVNASHTLGSLRHVDEPVPDELYLRHNAAALWTLGAEIDWAAISGDTVQLRTPLPTYPFARKRYFIEPVAKTARHSVTVDSALPAPVETNQFHQATSISDVPAHNTTLEAAPKSTQTMSREQLIQSKLQQILHELSGLEIDDIEVNETFLDMGFDSLFLTQANLRFKKEFKVKITFRQLFDVAPTVAALAAYIDQQLPEEALAELLQAAPPATPSPGNSAVAAPQLGTPTATLATSGNTSALQQAVVLQLQANSALLQALQSSVPIVQASIAVAAGSSTASSPISETKSLGMDFKPTASMPAATGRFGPFKEFNRSLSAELSIDQRAYLDDFIKSYVAKTAKSKAYTEEHRPHYADPRAVSGFKQAWKEITYPIVGERSKGAKVWDIDGNEYIDCAGGFGATFFGHAPDFLLDAISKQMAKSLDYGPQSLLAGPTAKLICELTGMDRASFCNTGSEAVLAAMRIARTVTGNDIIVSFAGSYHGIFDEVLVRPQEIGGVRRNKAIAPGIPSSSNQNIVVLEYGDPASLEYIATIADDIAAVIVEPIQSRNPELQPKEFVQKLRKLTREREVPLIFDEIITGFRLHPKGAQAWYDVDADICAYGKVVGGGMPVGVVAGKSEFMDALDGGHWQYGDDSFPEAGVTYFAGTFVRHPAALAAVNAAMTRLKEAGPSLQADLNRRTALFCERVNRAYHQAGVPIELTYFSSVILPRFRGNPDYEGLYYHHLRHRGVHIWEGRPGFMSTEHGDEEFSMLLDRFVAAATDLQKAGFLPGTADHESTSVVENHPWTPAQSELWLALAMGQDARSAYNEQVLCDVAGAVDTEVLELTFDKVANRHSSLRAKVAEDELSIDIPSYTQPEYRVIDLRDLPAAQREARARALASENIDRNFDLKQGPLIRLLVIQLDADRHWLCVAASHLICDGWSLEIILQDLCHFYNAMREGRQIDRGTPPSLADFQAALTEMHSPEDLAEAKQYWLDQYTNPPEPASLPLDFRRPAVKTYVGERQSFNVDAATAERLRRFAKEQGCTLFVVALAAFQLLMHKLTRSDDVVVGIPAAGQPTVGMLDLVTHDVSFLPLRGLLDSTLTLPAFLQRVRDNFNQAQEYQCFAYGDLLQHINLPRDPSRIPLITSSFNMDQEMTPTIFGETKAEFLTTPRGFVKYDLFFNLTDFGEGRGLALEVDHNSDLVTQTKATAWSTQYTALLTQLPTILNDVLMADISLTPATSPNKTHRLVGKEVPEILQGQTLVSLFESAVDIHPSNVALVDGEVEMSYAELDTQANKLANWLVCEGVERGDRVALVAERSMQMLVSMYAVIKAGAAYLPLDPEHPDQRLAEIVSSANVRLILCDGLEQPRIDQAVDDSIRVVAADAADAEWRSANGLRLGEASPRANDLAYVIYTSGSTGKPKGVMIEHEAICNRLLWGQSELPIEEHDVVLLKTPYTFDVSLWELFWPLQVGARLVIAKPGGHADPGYLHQLLKEQKITLAHFVPSMLTQFLAHPNREELPMLRRVYCTGEALTGTHQSGFFAAYPHAELYNMYGPTEAAVEVMYWCCRPETEVQDVPIGYPMFNTQLYVLDENLVPVAPGETGELYLAGAQLARGYLNSPEQTAEVFFDHEFPEHGKVRLYRTGDLVRELDGGILVYLGRIDSQIKLRGFRIELGEIEVKLLAQESVTNAAVLVQHMGENDDRLVAYVVPRQGQTISELRLRRELNTLLPHYMVPQHFVELASMPLTSSGKVDRNELIAAYASQAGPQSVVDPSTPEEQAIAEIWAKALKIEKVSADSYFFEIGGHSLLAMSVGREIESRLGKRFDLKELLLNNLAQLAAAAAASSSRESANDSNTAASPPQKNRGGLLGRLFD